MRSSACAVFCVAVCAALAGRAGAQDLVAPTDPLTPAEQHKTFRLPPGFEIQLVAAEPDIQKPMNLAFDAKGRLWVTDTIEYPHAAPEGVVPRDSVKVLEDFGEDGRAKKITTFADELNIPLGVLPTRDGALVYAIPNIFKFTDADGDGRAEKREVLIGPYGSQDTHGMTNHFTVGFDGWVYACHGFSNSSNPKALDGSEITMQSGHVYRFRPDGSRIEHYTRGQVNPFGLCFDPMGNLYSADCHSRPQYMLLRGAFYPSFGKPHDGLGFGPEMIFHDHGSTAIASTLYYAADHFPEEYRGTLFNGNPVTGKLNHDRLEWHGSSPRAVELPDFLSSDDPWFRPVDIELGPDAAIYVADFYNRIIGHYEVPLDHPGRDRDRGRIWRIVYRGADGAGPAPKMPNLSGMTVGELVKALGDANLAVRMTAMNLLVERLAEKQDAAALATLEKPATPIAQAHAIWVLHRLGALKEQTLLAAAGANEAIARTHAMRVLSETKELTPALREAAVMALKDADAHVQRAAADALGRHPAFENVRPLLDLRHSIDPAEDTHLLHVVRMSLRDQLSRDGVSSKLPIDQWSEADGRALADVIQGVASSDAGSFLVKFIRKYPPDPQTTADYLRHAARYLPVEDVPSLADLAAKTAADDLDLQLSLYRSVRDGLAQRGVAPGDAMDEWGARLAPALLASLASDEAEHWSFSPLPESDSAENPWVVQLRDSADGRQGEPFWSSLPKGEQRTGMLRSGEFEVPSTLRFFVAGHYGPPGTNEPSRNWVRLRDAKTGEVLAEAPPPRDDVAREVVWDLAQFAGRRGYIELTDGEVGDGWAWIAAGRIEPLVVRVPSSTDGSAVQRVQVAAEIAGSLRLQECAGDLAKLLGKQSLDAEARAAAARALAAIDPAAGVPLLGAVAGDPTSPPVLRDASAQALTDINTDASRAALIEALSAASQHGQRSLAIALASNLQGAEALLKAVGEGKASPRLLQDPPVRERLNNSNPPDLENRIAELTKNIQPLDEALSQLIEQRRNDFLAAPGDPVRGHAVFLKNCAACHRIGEEGSLIAPQLDGLSKRGVDRIAEDILDPNRNIDIAFRVHLVRLKGGDTVAGLPRREEGDVLVLADSTGKEVMIQKSQIDRRVESPLSLMPSNFGEIIPPEEFNDLMAFLATK